MSFAYTYFIIKRKGVPIIVKSRQEIKKQARELIAKDNLWLAVGLPTLVLTLVNLVFAFNKTTGVSSAIVGLALLLNLCAKPLCF